MRSSARRAAAAAAAAANPHAAADCFVEDPGVSEDYAEPHEPPRTASDKNLTSQYRGVCW